MTRAPEPLGALQNSFVLSVLPPRAQEDLAALAREERYQPGTLVARQGEIPDRLWFVAEGSVQLGLYAPDGRVSLLSPIAAGGWATWIACFSPSPWPHDIWTESGARLLAFPAEAVRRAAQAYPVVYPRVIARMGERTRELIGWSLAASLLDPEARLAYLLAHNCRQISQAPDGPIELSLTQERIGQMGLGTRQRVGRLLVALEKRGLVRVRYGGVQVVCLDALERFAGRAGLEGP